MSSDLSADVTPIAVPGPAPVAEPAPPVRSAADLRMRRILRLPVDAPSGSIVGAHDAFSKSIAISAVRCMLTYVALPLLAPVVNLTGSTGPIIGLVLSAVSIVAIVLSTRRFFAADHRSRWAYFAFGGTILVLLFVGGVVDVVHLAT